MNSENLYPEEVLRKLVDDDLPWDKSAKLSLCSFLEKYTLHDSYWIGVTYNVGFDQSATLSFQWDSVWLPDDVKERSSIVDDWPYLFIKLDVVYQISTANYIGIDYMSRAISAVEMVQMEGIFHLAIDDVYGGQVNIEHSGSSSILALNPDGSILRI